MLHTAEMRMLRTESVVTLSETTIPIVVSEQGLSQRFYWKVDWNVTIMSWNDHPITYLKSTGYKFSVKPWLIWMVDVDNTPDNPEQNFLAMPYKEIWPQTNGRRL